MASSLDQHPTNGARFVLTRENTGEDVVVYAVEVFLPGEESARSRLTLDGNTATCDPPFVDARVQSETLKLARVLKRTPKARLTRWRDLS